jgi:hypothetical protein
MRLDRGLRQPNKAVSERQPWGRSDANGRAYCLGGRRLLRSNSMADEHSEPSGMKVLRLYADALGESRFETTTMPMALKEFAPPAAPLRVSDPQPAQNYVILA